MKNFLLRFGAAVAGVLHGFDRLRFRGSKRQLCHVAGMMSWLGHLRIPLKEYKTFARDTTVSLCRSIEGPAVAADIYEFLNNSRDSKEEMALQIAAKQKRTSGLIAVLGCVEPCQVMQVRGNRETEKLELKVEPGKCKHYYHYYLDPVYGLRYTRLQSWFPFTMHIGLNGRDWLAQQMNKAGIAYRRDLRGLLFADLPTKPAEVKTQSAKVTRLLRLLRAHGLIDKIAKSHRYQATETGLGKVTALLAARHANTKQLLSAA